MARLQHAGPEGTVDALVAGAEPTRWRCSATTALAASGGMPRTRARGGLS